LAFRLHELLGVLEKLHDWWPSGYIKCWEPLRSCTTGGFSRKAQLRGVRLVLEKLHDWWLLKKGSAPWSQIVSLCDLYLNSVAMFPASPWAG
jgi:hypothetical protein